MRVVIFGADLSGEAVYNDICKNHSEWEIVGFADNDKEKHGEEFCNKKVYSADEVAAMYKSKIDKFIIAVSLRYVVDIYNQLTKSGISCEDIMSYSKQQVLRDGTYGYCEFDKSSPELYQIEISIADHCNLNCKGCAHFSNIVEEYFQPFDGYAKDIRRLKQLVPYIQNIYILGGEPLLCNNLDKYIEDISEVYPDTVIHMVTNALLLEKMSPQLIELIKSKNVKVETSQYPYVKKNKEKIEDFFKKNNIDGIVREEVMTFTKYLTVDENSDIETTFNNCPRSRCVILKESMIAACCQPLLVGYYNDKFNENLSTEGGIYIYDENLKGIDLIKRLREPIGACKNCTSDVEFEWKTAYGNNAKKEDWIV